MDDVCDVCGCIVSKVDSTNQPDGSCLCSDCVKSDDVKENAECNEGIQQFDRFMDNILISEGHGRRPTLPEDNPQRRRAALRQDRPSNKIRFGNKLCCKKSH